MTVPRGRLAERRQSKSTARPIRVRVTVNGEDREDYYVAAQEALALATQIVIQVIGLQAKACAKHRLERFESLATIFRLIAEYADPQRSVTHGKGGVGGGN